MLKKLTDLLQRLINVETVTYVFFGVCTTIVNLVVFKIFNIILGERLYLVSNVIAWIAAVVFAYITNKLWVFESKSFAASVLKKEIPSFVAARVLSFIIEEGGLYLLVDILGFDKYALGFSWLENGTASADFAVGGTMLSKIFIAIIVIVMNYFFSKLLIFKKDNK